MDADGSTLPAMIRSRRSVISSVGVILAGIVGVGSAGAAVKVGTAQRNAAIATLAKSSAAKSYALRAKGAVVTMSDWGARIRVPLAVAHRSQIDPDFTRVDLVVKGGQLRLTGLVERVGKRQRVHYFGPRWDFAEAICKRPAPGALVLYDLGLDPVDDNAYGVRACRYDRRATGFTRRMNAAEIAGIRKLAEPREYSVVHPDGGSEFGMRPLKRPALPRCRRTVIGTRTPNT